MAVLAGYEPVLGGVDEVIAGGYGVDHAVWSWFDGFPGVLLLVIVWDAVGCVVLVAGFPVPVPCGAVIGAV